VEGAFNQRNNPRCNVSRISHHAIGRNPYDPEPVLLDKRAAYRIPMRSIAHVMITSINVDR